MAKYARDLLTLPRHELWVINTSKPWITERCRIGVLAVKARIVYAHFNPHAPHEHSVLGATVFLTKREAKLRRHGLLCRLASQTKTLANLETILRLGHGLDAMERMFLQLSQGPMVYRPTPDARGLAARMARQYRLPVPPWATPPAKPPAQPQRPMRSRELRLVYSRPE